MARCRTKWGQTHRRSLGKLPHKAIEKLFGANLLVQRVPTVLDARIQELCTSGVYVYSDVYASVCECVWVGARHVSVGMPIGRGAAHTTSKASSACRSSREFTKKSKYSAASGALCQLGKGVSAYPAAPPPSPEHCATHRGVLSLIQSHTARLCCTLGWPRDGSVARPTPARPLPRQSWLALNALGPSVAFRPRGGWVRVTH
jgi:hypothetical protein